LIIAWLYAKVNTQGIETHMNSHEKSIARQREYFRNGHTVPVAGRVAGLRSLQSAMEQRHSAIEAALEADLKRNRFESFLAEILLLQSELKKAVKNTARWSAPRRVLPSVLNFCSRDRIVPEPYGVVLIISPWNYPFLLSLGPLIAAISAGNCVVLKPSSFAPASSAVLAEIVGSAFPEEYAAVVQGGAGTAQALLEHKFDKIFFTGSARVGRLVLQAAARHITPVTLELGGKSPCIVTESAELRVASRRIVWGKLLNAGQTCVAPDYILVQRSKKDELITRLVESITAFYGNDIRRNPDYPRIIGEKHHARLLSYLDAGKIVWGGDHDGEDLYFGPTLLADVTWEDRIMKEEIFGPLLPLIAYDSLEEVIERVNAREEPLSLYLFTADKKQIETVWSRCRFGGGCVNDTLSHLLNSRLPFGGTGNSGMGSYHGRWGFETFSHQKSLVHRTVRPDIPLRYPPYSNKGWLKNLLLKVVGR
jgi:aldehyde dehydrogenase (NAD+)